MINLLTDRWEWNSVRTQRVIQFHAVVGLCVSLTCWCCLGLATQLQATTLQSSSSETTDKLRDQSEAKEDATEPTEPRVYASVNGFEIGDAELRFLLDQLQPVSKLQTQQLKLLKETKPKPTRNADSKSKDGQAIDPTLREALIQHWIERLLVLSYLQTNDLAVGEQQIAAEFKRLENSFRDRGDDLKVHLQNQGIKTSVYETHLAWQLGWKKFVDDRINDQSLDKYYQVSHRRFDGTQLRIAHVVQTFEGVSTDEEKKSLVIQFQDLKQQIDNKKMSFSEAAAQWSQGSSAKSGGELGWIDYAGPLSPEVTQAAFQTNVGEISPPVITATAVHLVRVLEEKAGEIPFAENKDRVRSAMISDLWNWTVSQQQDQASIVRH